MVLCHSTGPRKCSLRALSDGTVHVQKIALATKECKRSARL